MKLDILINDAVEAKNISGTNGSNLKVLEELYSCDIDINGEDVVCNLEDSNEIYNLTEVIKLMKLMLARDLNVNPRDIIYINNIVKDGRVNEYIHFIENRKPIAHTLHNKPIYPKTLMQDNYIKTMEKKDLVFAIGAAGTGKTYLAVCYAVALLKRGDIGHIILTRPAVEAGESLGFLPGDLKEKVDPYLRPLYDALYDMLGVEATQSLIEKQVIEIAPLAYMRGRTLEDAFIILDEAQNATIDQLKMFLTRLGFNSKMIVTGDISQVDLPNAKKSGLKISASLLQGLSEVGTIVFEKHDVVRHPLVAKIIEKFERITG